MATHQGALTFQRLAVAVVASGLAPVVAPGP